MKHLFVALAGAALLSGCCAYCDLNRNIEPGALINGEKPIATFYVQNTSYQILGFIPWCTGTTWTEDDIPCEDRNNWRINFFSDTCTLDSNIQCLKRACREVGSNRIASLSHNIFEDNIWSFLLVNRRTIKTNCFILEPKSK